MLKEYKLGFGKAELSLMLPEERIINDVKGKPVAAITDIRQAIKEAVTHPIASAPLAEKVKPGEKVIIVVSDITRAWIKYDKFLPAILDELNGCGIPDKDIRLIVGLGSHRKHTPEDHVLVYGREAADRVEILQSYALDEDDFRAVGETSRGVKVAFNKHVLDADRVILTGGLVYHQMCGFGGGRKSILPGISGYATIQHNHSFCLTDEVGGGIHPNSASGKLDGNRMHEDMMEIGQLLKPDFLINIILTPEGKFARFVAGDWAKAWEEGCKIIDDIYGVPIKARTDLVIASAGGFPKDINLYQGSKTNDNAFKAVKDDGVVILVMECPEIMEPPDFSGWFDLVSLHDRELALRKEFTVPGFIALKIGIMAQKVPHIAVTAPQNKEFMERAGITPVTTIEEAMRLAEEKLAGKEYTITLMTQAANTMPIVPDKK